MQGTLAFIIRSCVYLACLGLSYYGCRAIRFDVLIQKNRVGQAQVLYFLIMMSLAYLSGSFLLQFLYFK